MTLNKTDILPMNLFGALMLRAKAVAPSNIAIVKYWGKRDEVLNLPATSSISITLSKLKTEVCVSFDENLGQDEVFVEDERANEKTYGRVVAFLDLVRAKTKVNMFARVESFSNFPVGSGLASSASFFAGLTLASANALSAEFTFQELARIARQGSGSAPRSLLGGAVEAVAGTSNDGSDFEVLQILPEERVPFALLVVMVESKGKAISSRDGMNLCKNTSPYFHRWLEYNQELVDIARMALLDGDIKTVGEVAEASCFAMHGCCMSAKPPLFYWAPNTLSVIEQVFEMRKEGVLVYVTIDAGPHPVLLAPFDLVPIVRERVSKQKGVLHIIEERAGQGAKVL
jgi:diphosphomevalonate decarboxylase